MHRVIRFVVVTLLLGAITTVLVAWACEYFLRPADVLDRMAATDERFSHADLPRWVVTFYKGTGYGIVQRAPAQGGWRDAVRPVIIAPKWSRMSARPLEAEYPDSRVYYEIVSGWPLLSMRTDVVFTGQSARTIEWDVAGGITHSYADWGGPIGVIPCIPMLSGFTIDTLIFATAWGVVLVSVSRARARVRRLRGRCIDCGYDLTGLHGTRCPECGKGQPIGSLKTRRPVD